MPDVENEEVIVKLLYQEYANTGLNSQVGKDLERDMKIFDEIIKNLCPQFFYKICGFGFIRMYLVKELQQAKIPEISIFEKNQRLAVAGYENDPGSRHNPSRQMVVFSFPKELRLDHKDTRNDQSFKEGKIKRAEIVEKSVD